MLVFAAGVALAWLGNHWADVRARAGADASARQVAQSHVALLTSELQKFRLLPLVLGQYPDVATALTRDARAARRLDTTLETLAARTDAAAIYVIDATGRTVAASNAALPTSFVGQNYAFRPYFRDAMRRGGAELFALGTISGRPGLYLARRVDRAGRAIGVVVVKVEFDSVESAWARSAGATIVTDRHGVILVTSVPACRFGATGALDAATLADARSTLQFGATPPRRAPLRLDGRAATATLAGETAPYRVATEPAPLASARLIHLAPLAPPLAAARLEALLWGLAVLIVIGVAAALIYRGADRRHIQHQARLTLEAEVARRTIELREANAQLIVESTERADADRRFRAAREELAQANRLGTLGQITAGIAHEINQPVAAIRTFAENGVTLLDRDAAHRTRENLGQIVALTDRIGTITREMRAFARRRTPSSGTTALDPVIDDTLFTPFASAKPNGLGLGLAIARDIAREFGGDIVHLPGDGGATFVARFRAA